MCGLRQRCELCGGACKVCARDAQGLRLYKCVAQDLGVVALRGASQAPFAAVQYFGRLPVPQVSSACIQFFAKLSVFRQKRGLLDAGRSSARLAVRLRIVVLPESRFDLRKRRVSKRASFRLGAEMRRVSNNSSSCQPNRPIIREVAEKPSRTRIIGCRRV